MAPPVAVDLLMLVAGLAILWVSAHNAIRSTVRLAEATRISEMSIGFLLLAFTTSIPELAVTLASPFASATDLAVGNLLGSNVANIGLVIGLPFLLLNLRRPRIREAFPVISSEEVNDIFFGLFVASVVPLFLIVLPAVARAMGVVLVLAYFYFSWQIVRRQGPKEPKAPRILKSRRSAVMRDALITALGIAGIVGSAYFIVESGASLSRALGFPDIVVGGIVVALGTSLPELAISLSAALSGKGSLAIGNAVGSCFTNITLLFGILLVIAPAVVLAQDFLVQSLFSIIMNLFMWRSLVLHRLNTAHAAQLVGIYALFVLVNVGLL